MMNLGSGETKDFVEFWGVMHFKFLHNCYSIRQPLV